MEKLTTRWKKIREANKVLDRIFKDKDECFLVHYSCESFVDNSHGSLKVTSIAIRKLDSAQTKSYSIFQYAELLKVSSSDIELRYSEIEKLMLQDYFNLLKDNAHKTFIHWNMRDINYGFQAIEHRGRVLDCDIFELPDTSKVDLARLLVKRYGINYIGHPRLEKLIDLNKITKNCFLTGKEEAVAFENGEFLKLHQSTLRKVHCFENIIERIGDNSLKVDSSFFDIYGLELSVVWRKIKEHWLFVIVASLGAIGVVLLNWNKLISFFFFSK